jgi:shikimate dehydrogenase
MSNYAVLGSPISHSLSPVLHNAAFQALKLEHSYSAHEVTELAEFLDSNVFQGLSLTMPLKRQGFDLAISHDLDSKLTSACNTLVYSDSGWLGFNTDVFGLRKALSDSDKSAVTILGSGATAFSSVVALKDDVTQISIRARNKQTAQQLTDFATGLGIIVSSDTEFRPSLVISTTDPSDSDIPAGVELFDAIYAKDNLRFAKHPGPKISGLEMLFWQALAQQRLFFHGDPNKALPQEPEVITAMRQALSLAVGE